MIEESFRQLCTPNPGPGLLVLLEGGDGTGKSTIKERLRNHFPDAAHTGRIGGEDIPEELDVIWRRMLMNGDAQKYPYLWQGYSFCNNMESQVQVQEQALRSGRLVIADRGWPSQICYGEAVGCDKKWLRSMVRPLYYPDLTFVFLRRHMQGPDAVEQDRRLQNRVRSNYRGLIASERWWEAPDLTENEMVLWAATRIRRALRLRARQ